LPTAREPPLRSEIEARDASRLREATEQAAEALDDLDVVT
jgi:hypothetical protein